MAEYDLISKTALLKHLDMAVECKDCPRNANKELYKCVHNPTSERCTCSDIAQICIRITDFAPSADVQLVRHGKWVDEFYSELLECFVATCSVCNYDSGDRCRVSETHRFCEYCGATMDGDTNG